MVLEQFLVYWAFLRDWKDDKINFNYSFFNIFEDFIYLFLERGREREREGESEEENHECVVAVGCPLLGMWPTTQACALTGD